MEKETFSPPVTGTDQLSVVGQQRRKLFKIFGASAAFVSIAAACHKSDSGSSTTTSVSLGSGDIGILNYAYALEQLEAAFYTQVIATPYSGMTTDEKSGLTDIMNHEIAHREFFKNALGSSAIAGLTVNFSTIDFTSRTSVLGTAMAFEDLGVSAYNGAGSLITTADYLVLAGKIVSVEARHAAYIRDLITYNSFAGTDVVAASNGLEMSRTPTQVLSIAGAYVTTKIDASQLPS